MNKSGKTCRQDGCESVVERPRKRSDCNSCYNRIRRELYAEDEEYRSKVRERCTRRVKTVEGRKSRMVSDAKLRAMDSRLEFNLTTSDINIPSHCPYLGIELSLENTKKLDNSPTLDKIIPSLGYVVGNVEVISERANRIKNNATPEELFMIAERYNKILGDINGTEFPK